MKNLLLLSAILIFSFACGKETVNPQEEDTQTTEDTQASADITTEILNLTNQHRKKLGKAALTRSSVADDFAKQHTNYMIGKGTISHDNFQSRMGEMSKKVAMKGSAENVAMGYPTAEAVMKGWINSDGHRKNIEGDYTHIGIAAIKDKEGRYYYTQIFFKK